MQLKRKGAEDRGESSGLEEPVRVQGATATAWLPVGLDAPVSLLPRTYTCKVTGGRERASRPWRGWGGQGLIPWVRDGPCRRTGPGWSREGPFKGRGRWWVDRNSGDRFPRVRPPPHC